MLSFLMPSRSQFRPDDESYWVPFGGRAKTSAGVVVDEEVALKYSTVFLCTRAITEPISSMPIVCYERQADGNREVATDAGALAVVDAVSLVPNDEMSAMPWREGRTMHQVNFGNGYSYIERDPRSGRPMLWPIHPSRMAAADKESGYDYVMRRNDGTLEGFTRSEILHCCGTLSDDGVFGRGIIQYARESIGFGLAVEKYGSAFFGSGGQPKGIIITPGLRQREDRRQFRQEWKEIHSAPDSSEVAILPPDSSYTPIAITNQDRQFIETRNVNRKTIAQWYRVPGYMIGERETVGNVEAQGIEFIIYTLYPWAKRWEEQLALKLLPKRLQPTHYFEHDFSSLLRGNREARMNSYRVALGTGVYTINECRRFENLPSIGPAGDVHYVPANMFTAERMMKEGSSAGASSGPGSDHSGSPADNPLDHELVAIGDLTTKSQRIEFKQATKRLALDLEDRPTRYVEDARIAFTESLSRMYVKEANAAIRASKDKDFDAWMREFYAKHEIHVADSVRAACCLLHVAGGKRFTDHRDVAAWLVSRSKQEIMASYNSDSREVFTRKLEAWPHSRAGKMADEIILASTSSPVEMAMLDLGRAMSAVASREQPAPVVNVTIPKQETPVVNVNVPKAEPATVTVNVPEAAAPVVNVSVPKQEPPIVNVNVPKQKPLPGVTIERDAEGKAVRLRADLRSESA